MNLLRIDDRQIGGHIEIRSGRDAVTETQLRIRESVSNGKIGRAALIAGKNAVDRGAVPRTAVVSSIELELLGAVREIGAAGGYDTLIRE